jgi:PAS domain-containing protein
MITDLKGYILDVNQAFETITGYHPPVRSLARRPDCCVRDGT